MKELKDICFQSRTKAGLSQEQFAKIIGSTQTEISFTERGFIPASEEKVQRIINFAKQIEDKEG